jgi:hypothetical protein
MGKKAEQFVHNVIAKFDKLSGWGSYSSSQEYSSSVTLTYETSSWWIYATCNASPSNLGLYRPIDDAHQKWKNSTSGSQREQQNIFTSEDKRVGI